MSGKTWKKSHLVNSGKVREPFCLSNKSGKVMLIIVKLKKIWFSSENIMIIISFYRMLKISDLENGQRKSGILFHILGGNPGDIASGHVCQSIGINLCWSSWPTLGWFNDIFFHLSEWINITSTLCECQLPIVWYEIDNMCQSPVNIMSECTLMYSRWKIIIKMVEIDSNNSLFAADITIHNCCFIEHKGKIWLV